MASNQRPKFRSSGGCCICGRKSSSSRFAPSKRWEHLLIGCFELKEKRFGIICNACVLIVKRYDRQIQSSSSSGVVQTWTHVVDSRIGPGTKNMNKIKKKIEAIKEEQYSSSSSSSSSLSSFQNGLKTTNDCFGMKWKNYKSYEKLDDETKTKKTKRNVGKMILRRIVVPENVRRETHPQVEGYETCCGIIYVSPTYDRTWRHAFPFFRPCGRVHSKAEYYESDSSDDDDDDDDDETIITKLQSFISSSSSSSQRCELDSVGCTRSPFSASSSSSSAPPSCTYDDNNTGVSWIPTDDVDEEAVDLSPPGSTQTIFSSATDAEDSSCVQSGGSDVDVDLPFASYRLDSSRRRREVDENMISNQRCATVVVVV